MRKKHKKFIDRLTYAYIRKVKKWILCPNCRDGKMVINKKYTVWVCEECEYKLSDDECKAYLNNQDGFKKFSSKHICQNCGYENDTTFNNAKGICSDCGKIILDTDSTLCADCKQSRREKATQWLVTAGKVVGAFATFAGVAYLTSISSDDENANYTSFSSGDDNDEGGFIMKCADCGNTNESSLLDEDDNIHFSSRHHRTTKDIGEDDLVECPYCHRMRDRKAYYCRYCNDSTWKSSSPKEFVEINKNLKEMGY